MATAATSLGARFTICTGGAIGTDSLAQQLAKEWGMGVKLCLAPHHHKVSEKYPAISREDLDSAMHRVHIASARLKRHPTKNPFVRDLLARNWFIVRDSQVIYAYANFEDDSLTTVEGGTGMTVQMCVDHNRDYPEQWKELFVFDESRDSWYELERDESWDLDEVVVTESLGDLGFRECFCGPILHPRSAVVGSRTLGELGRLTLKDQFKRTIKEYIRWRPKEEDGDREEEREKVEKLCKLVQEMSIQEKDTNQSQRKRIKT